MKQEKRDTVALTLEQLKELSETMPEGEILRVLVEFVEEKHEKDGGRNGNG